MTAEPTPPATTRPEVTIAYCTGCRWLNRAAWMSVELLTTFPTQLDVRLSPAEPGTFQVHLDGNLLFCRKTEARFPQPKEIKQAIRDRIDPNRDLGHSDSQ